MIYQLNRKLYNIILYEVCNKKNQYNAKYKGLNDHEKVLLYINEEFLVAPKTVIFCVEEIEGEYVLRMETKDVVPLVTKLTIIEG